MTEAEFESRYQQQSDPFGVGTRWYERRKQQVLLSSLGRERYRLAWDAACGTGHLAQALAARCDRVLATDAAPTAVELSRSLTCRQPGVDCAVSALPARPESARGADLTVAAEILYYLPDDLRAETVSALAAQVGELATVHWRHHPHDAHLSGAAVTEELDSALARSEWERTVWHDDTDFVIGVWTRKAFQ